MQMKEATLKENTLWKFLAFTFGSYWTYKEIINTPVAFPLKRNTVI